MGPDHGRQIDTFPLLRIIAEKKEQINPCVTPDSPSAARLVRDPLQAHVRTSTRAGEFRQDARCGHLFDGAKCDPDSEFYCCSEYGFCGNTTEHCGCDKCVDSRLVIIDKVRSDARCGSKFPLDENGTPSQCGGNLPCCSPHGWCGNFKEHCSCDSCVDYRSEEEKAEAERQEQQVEWVEGKWRADRRCGPDYPLPDGSEKPGECDPNSDFFCCSKWGYCGGKTEFAAHCSCPECVNYKPAETEAEKEEETETEEECQEKEVKWVEEKWRTDGRCGHEFPLPDESGKPGECDPNSDFFCCSKWGFCGSEAVHCSCPECVNYKLTEE